MSVSLSAMWANVQGAEPRSDGPTEFSLWLLRMALREGQVTWEYISWATGCINPRVPQGWEDPCDASQALNSYVNPMAVNAPRGIYAGAIIGHLYGVPDDEVEQFVINAQVDSTVFNALTYSPQTAEEVEARIANGYDEERDAYCMPEDVQASLGRLAEMPGVIVDAGRYWLDRTDHG
jgi:hypothetical protein